RNNPFFVADQIAKAKQAGYEAATLAPLAIPGPKSQQSISEVIRDGDKATDVPGSARTPINLLGPESARTPIDRLGPQSARTPTDRLGPESARTPIDRLGPESARIPTDSLGPVSTGSPIDALGPDSGRTPTDRLGSTAGTLTNRLGSVKTPTDLVSAGSPIDALGPGSARTPTDLLESVGLPTDRLGSVVRTPTDALGPESARTPTDLLESAGLPTGRLGSVAKTPTNPIGPVLAGSPTDLLESSRSPTDRLGSIARAPANLLESAGLPTGRLGSVARTPTDPIDPVLVGSPTDLPGSAGSPTDRLGSAKTPTDKRPGYSGPTDNSYAELGANAPYNPFGAFFVGGLNPPDLARPNEGIETQGPESTLAAPAGSPQTRDRSQSTNDSREDSPSQAGTELSKVVKRINVSAREHETGKLEQLLEINTEDAEARDNEYEAQGSNPSGSEPAGPSESGYDQGAPSEASQLPVDSRRQSSVPLLSPGGAETGRASRRDTGATGATARSGRTAAHRDSRATAADPVHGQPRASVSGDYSDEHRRTSQWLDDVHQRRAQGSEGEGSDITSYRASEHTAQDEETGARSSKRSSVKSSRGGDPSQRQRGSDARKSESLALRRGDRKLNHTDSDVEIIGRDDGGCGDEVCIRGLTIILHLRGKDDLVINTDLTGEDGDCE
ncbi:hypothetical protein V8F33_008289, partial [Rhypophila sp. PSN 637]